MACAGAVGLQEHLECFSFLGGGGLFGFILLFVN